MSRKNKKINENIDEIQTIIVCLNPQCGQSNQRCLNSTSIRSHPSECSPHYFPVQTILNKHWQQISDYPTDALGMSIKNKVSSFGKQSSTVFKKIVQNFKGKLENVLNLFVRKFEENMPSSLLEDFFSSMYSLDKIAQYFADNRTPQYICQAINFNFSSSKYNQLQNLNEKYNSLLQSFDSIILNLKANLKGILDEMLIKKSVDGKIDMTNVRFEGGKMKPKIEYGMMKSKYIVSSKIQSVNGQLRFPKLQSIASFLPWAYCDHSFKVGIHELKIVSQKFASHPNSGLCVLQEHDIDTYPYHIYKSLFSKQGKGFELVSPSEIDELEQYGPKNKIISKRDKLSGIQHTIGQVSEITLRLQLNTKPRAIIQFQDESAIYYCPLREGKSYRMGIYGSGWNVTVKSLY